MERGSMTDSLTVFGTDFTGVTGIKATGTGNGTLTYIRPQGTKSISANGSGIDVTEYAAVDVAVPTGTPRTSTDLTVSGDTVTAPAGYYASAASKSVASGTAGTPTATKTIDHSDAAALIVPSVTNTTGYITGGTKTGTQFYVTAGELVAGNSTVADESGDWDVTDLQTLTIPAGTAGTPTATKGSVSNHAISVTPSVTNTTGYITGSTKTGTAVTVSASELVSGSETKTANGTYDVTNLASLVVAVDYSTIHTGSSAPTSSQGANGDVWLVTS